MQPAALGWSLLAASVSPGVHPALIGHKNERCRFSIDIPKSELDSVKMGLLVREAK